MIRIPCFDAVFLAVFLAMLLTGGSFISLAVGQDISSKPDTLFGLAMHGTPMHDQEDTHLRYVNPNAPKGGTVRFAALGTFDSLNPFAIKGLPAEGWNFMYERLMGRSWDD